MSPKGCYTTKLIGFFRKLQVYIKVGLTVKLESRCEKTQLATDPGYEKQLMECLAALTQYEKMFCGYALTRVDLTKVAKESLSHAMMRRRRLRPSGRSLVRQAVTSHWAKLTVNCQNHALMIGW